MIATTIEKSRRLLELGLSLDSADMFWMDTNSVKPCLNLMDDGIFNHRNYLVRFPNSSLPAWSLSALLEVMRKANAVTTLQVTSLSTLMRCKDMGFIWQNDLYIYDPTTAAYEMVCYLLRNNLIEKGGNDE